jgi:hypothetical protein
MAASGRHMPFLIHLNAQTGHVKHPDGLLDLLRALWGDKVRQLFDLDR